MPTLAIRAGLILTIAVNVLAAQVTPERERARSHYRKGWELMRVEAWTDAEREFQSAIDIDPQFEDAYYSLGRAEMALKKYADAINAYSKSRDLYRAQAGRQFSNQQDAQRYRQDRLTEIDEMIRQAQSGPQGLASQERMRQLQEYRRQLQLNFQRGGNITIENSVPAFVSLALGSAYFRAGKLEDAEREYKAAVAIDPKTGEAHSNLAVVYFETGRYDEAERSVAAAEKAGYKVHPQLKEDIKKRRKGAS
jgi:tetratricopeptide (TPR) repeat protein